jgi:hypothetical protein
VGQPVAGGAGLDDLSGEAVEEFEEPAEDGVARVIVSQPILAGPIRSCH